MSLEYSEEEDDSEGYIQLRMDPNVNLGQEQLDHNSSLILVHKNHKNDHEGPVDIEESEEDIEEGVPQEGEINNYEVFLKQQNNRYARQ